MILSDEYRLRRLSRALTTWSGALDDSFLGLGRPLGPARVLNAIGHGRSDVAELRTYLGLDSGQMSRLLRGLEGEGMIQTTPDEKDARRRRLSLTRQGQAEFQTYEDLSDAAASEILQGYPDRARLLAAMDLVATVLGRDAIKVVIADPEDPRVMACVQSYVDEISEIFETRFDTAASGDPEADSLRAPKGVFLLALSDGLPIGCCALKGQGAGLGEVKRLWVSPAARGLGLAKRLMQEIEDHARALNMTTLQLDTNGRLTAALEMYRRAGWREIDRYNDNPYAEHFFEKRIA
ncbi:MAG: helix-turn-helix domain-containing GNAT family N-acetyltransferase [Pelagimonas sp.]|jgi:DNA-binding MarR family transcriptional regulator|nr:helix-turn-helix domain-containing GNAT family N-acetyltransferase [Pelagimonas sp.]